MTFAFVLLRAKALIQAEEMTASGVSWRFGSNSTAFNAIEAKRAIERCHLRAGRSARSSCSFSSSPLRRSSAEQAGKRESDAVDENVT
jgi:hypothetical protein